MSECLLDQGPVEAPYAGMIPRGPAFITDLLLAILGSHTVWAFYPVLEVFLRPNLRILAVISGAAMLIPLLYFGVTTARWGATPGKMLAGLRVETIDGDTPRVGAALLRTVVQLLAALFLIQLVSTLLVRYLLGLFDFLWAALDRRRQTLHDKIARTVVVVEGNPHWLQLFVLAGASAIILFAFQAPFFTHTHVVRDGEMAPLLQRDDRVLVNTLVYYLRSPRRGEVVVIPAPKVEDAPRSIARRVVGLPGETVEIRDGAVLVNGRRLPGDYAKRDPEEDGRWKTPQRHYFLLADRTGPAQDSRASGPAARRSITGRASLVLLPPDRSKEIQ
jgi:signal peptidase I